MNYREHAIMAKLSCLALILFSGLTLIFNKSIDPCYLFAMGYSSIWVFEGNFFPDSDQLILTKDNFKKMMVQNLNSTMAFIPYWYILRHSYGINSNINIFNYSYLLAFKIMIWFLTLLLRYCDIYPYEAITHRKSLMHSKVVMHLLGLIYLKALIFLNSNMLSPLDQYHKDSTWTHFFIKLVMPSTSKTLMLILIPYLGFFIGIWGHYFIDCWGFLDSTKSYKFRPMDLIFTIIHSLTMRYLITALLNYWSIRRNWIR